MIRSSATRPKNALLCGRLMQRCHACHLRGLYMDEALCQIRSDVRTLIPRWGPSHPSSRFMILSGSRRSGLFKANTANAGDSERNGAEEQTRQGSLPHCIFASFNLPMTRVAPAAHWQLCRRLGVYMLYIYPIYLCICICSRMYTNTYTWLYIYHTYCISIYRYINQGGNK